jgi:plasmid stabilization system protein ParE
VTFTVVLTGAALEDLQRLFDFILDRELARGGDLALAEEAVAAIRAGFKTLERFPFTCRKTGGSPFLRELVIPFGASGYVALFEIEEGRRVVIGAIRHQREDDYH